MVCVCVCVCDSFPSNRARTALTAMRAFPHPTLDCSEPFFDERVVSLSLFQSIYTMKDFNRQFTTVCTKSLGLASTSLLLLVVGFLGCVVRLHDKRCVS
jgi:hypothetical protein